ncbi:MAG: hypothetical protein ACK5JM_12580, partial [Rhodoblastus sp.]
EPFHVGTLVDKTTLYERSKKIGFRTEFGHGRFLLKLRGLGGARRGGKPAGRFDAQAAARHS